MQFRVHIDQGDADEIFHTLLDCAAADFHDKNASSLYVEEVAALERPVKFRSEIAPGLKAYYEKKLIKHRHKKERHRLKLRFAKLASKYILDKALDHMKSFVSNRTVII